MRWHMCGAGWCVTCVWRVRDVIKTWVYEQELGDGYIWQGEHSRTFGNHEGLEVSSWSGGIMRGHAGWLILPVGVTLKWARWAACVWSCFRPPEANLRSCKCFTVVMRHLWGDYMVTSHIGRWLQLLLDLSWRVWKWTTYYGQVEQINQIANCFWAENGCWGSYIDCGLRDLKDFGAGLRCGGGLISCGPKCTIIFRLNWRFSEKPS